MLKNIAYSALISIAISYFSVAYSEQAENETSNLTNVCLSQLDDKLPILSVGPSLYDPLNGTTTKLLGLPEVSLLTALNHFQIGTQSGLSVTTSPLFEDASPKLNFSQILHTESGVIQTQSKPRTNLPNAVSVIDIGNFEIVTHENASDRDYPYQRATLITHQSGAKLRLAHEWIGGSIHIALNDDPNTLIIVGNFLSESSTVHSLSLMNGALHYKELAILKFQADRAYFDFQTDTLLYWRNGLDPLVSIKHMDFNATERASSKLESVYRAAVSKLHSDGFSLYRFDSNRVEEFKYFGEKTEAPELKQICTEQQKIDLHFHGKHFLANKSYTDNSEKSLAVILDGGPAFKQYRLSPEKKAILNQGWSILASDYPGSWGHGRSYLNNINPEDYQTWAADLCKIIEQQREDYQKITIRAYSFGAFAAAYLMNECDGDIDSYTLFAPAFGLKNYLTDKEIWHQTQFDPIIKRLIDHRLLSLEEKLLHEISRISASKVQVLIGENDDRISIDYVRKVIEEKNVDFLILNRMTHAIIPSKDYLQAAYGALSK